MYSDIIKKAGALPHRALECWALASFLCVVFPIAALHGADPDLLPAAPVFRPSASPSTNALERIVILGASASAGFTMSEPLGGPTTPQYRLSRYVDAAITAPHRPVRNLASTFFFMQPEAEAKRQVDLALEYRPTLVLGADFLFWFCYGDGPTDRERLLRFETGLKLCEAFRCPLVLGDIPDASAAVNSMLSPDEIPSPTAISAANRRLKLWAAPRPNIAVLSLSNFMAAVVGSRALSVHGHSLPKDTTSGLLQSDRLHPTPPGCAVLALLMLDAFHSNHPGAAAKAVRWDPKEVFRMGSMPPEGGATKPAASGGETSKGE